MNPFSLSKSDRKLSLLVDPDKHNDNSLEEFAQMCNQIAPDFILIGGSLIFKSNVHHASKRLKSLTDIPLVLFPGHFTQITDAVDTILLLSLISGRNPDLLIGQHVLAASRLMQIKEKVVSTGYMLIDGGKPTSVSYMSNSQPIPRDKEDIALCTAQAGELIGMDAIYLDAGSGAQFPVPIKMIEAVCSAVSIPVIVGGGIRNLSDVEFIWKSGANLVVIGNALENNNLQFSHELAGRSRY